LKKPNKLKLFNDPIYGFISIQDPLIFALIEHPYFQRLRRISQMGLSSLVFPGAHHTRFHHALGCLYLMQKAVRLLRFKQVEISKAEEQGLYIAILLHDIGHGPFSHALEASIVQGMHHETLSLQFMETLNADFDGKLAEAILIFKKQHPKKFLCELVSSQLDIDRMDYLKRDSFYTGIAEGNINSERIISMLNVIDNELVIEEKGIYSVEKFLMARRFMYWQAYLHKAGVGAEILLTQILKRAKDLTHLGEVLPGNKALIYFLKSQQDRQRISTADLRHFAALDDIDILAATKEWQNHPDAVLSKLSKALIDRKLFKMKLSDSPFSEAKLLETRNKVAEKWAIDDALTHYFVVTGQLTNLTYDNREAHIRLVDKKGAVRLLTNPFDKLIVNSLTEPVDKYYLCFPKKQP